MNFVRQDCRDTVFMDCRTNTSPPCCPRLRRRLQSGRVIVAHLGSGASLCALKDGKSVDSTLGFTALDGLCMGTRPGAIDPGVVLHLFQGLNMSAKRSKPCCTRNPVLGISGSVTTCATCSAAGTRGAARSGLFVYRAAKEIGALTAALGGLDGLSLHCRHRRELG